MLTLKAFCNRSRNKWRTSRLECSAQPLKLREACLGNHNFIRYQSSSPVAVSSKVPSSETTSPREYFGQPLPFTHPHLLKSDETTIGITAREYADRRKKLMDKLEDGSVVILAGGRLQWMAHHVFYPFRQSSDFWYLTGFQEPDSCLVLEKGNSEKGYEMTLFVRPKDLSKELWEGARTGVEGVVRWFAADKAFDIDQLATKLRPLLTQSTNIPIYLDLPDDAESLMRIRKSGSSLMNFFSPSASQDADLISLLSSPFRNSRNQNDIEACLNVLATAPMRQIRSRSKKSSKYRPIESLKRKLVPLKMIKSPAELKLLRKACDITARGHKAAMRLAAQTSEHKSQTEYDLVRAFETTCQGDPVGFGGRMGYVPVCAAGDAALTVHYTANDRMLQAGNQMVLLDAGFEYAGYLADITRSFPSGNDGKFTSPQRDLYEAVLSVQKDLISRCTEEESVSLSSLHRASCQLLRSALSQLGFDLKVPGTLEQLYPHYIGHPVGTDLHDTPTLDRTTQLKSGSVITIEPGIYVPHDDCFPSEFHGIGIRIEDMVQIKKKDYIVLSCNTPKEVIDVEACGSGLLENLN
ncbi:X-Pro aminopeptidase [Melampsora larici-populina 98AG31]|uniref:X-Pro aminopeptidase n=1 Tax=Melampsora larici-populina (strain 98AG31 / pathotype 3-4-7) TaxID=747676 RepID=F4SCT5_MELLP|nr:X-Pro aminopeptidase [Melampsora larici-populina 98AG31]EGF97535.1 X-Pro aminopeptidase [Melampsora larici-populina 98AG31]